MSALRLLALVATVGAALVVPVAAASPPPAMHLTIDIRYSQGHDEAAYPSNFAVRAGGTVTITFRNHTKLSHTFTIRALGVSALIHPSGSTTVTFVAPYGVYAWKCFFCASSFHPHMHAMDGRMYAIVNT